MELVHDSDGGLDDIYKAIQEMTLFIEAGGKTFCGHGPYRMWQERAQDA